MLRITVYCKPEPQGSVKAFMIHGKPRLTSDNAKVKPYRHTVAQVAAEQLSKDGIELPMAAKNRPVSLGVCWYFLKPPSAKKDRVHPAYKPDADKLLRATLDALTGIAYADDCQVVDIRAAKRYGAPERVEISVVEIKQEGPLLWEK